MLPRVLKAYFESLEIHETTFVTTMNNGVTREETKKDKRKSSGETVGVTFWPDPTQYVR